MQGEDLFERMNDCDFCSSMTKPLQNQVTFLHDYRQAIVYWRNTVQLISFEGLPDSDQPLYHEFSFHTVAMESYGLDLRKKEGGIGSTGMISSDEGDEDPDDISGSSFGLLHRFSNKAKASAAFSPIKKVQGAKETKTKPP